MIRRAGRPRPWWETLACATLALALAGCGGGGGGGGSGTTDPPPVVDPPSTESALLFAEFVAQDSNHQFVRVWDPARPDVAIQSVPIVQDNGIVWTSSHLVFSDATRYDPATRTVRPLGHVKAFFDSNGKVWAIDLRGGHSHVPVQLSSVVDARGMIAAWPLGADGVEAWVDVLGGASDWAVRSSMGATDAATAVRRIVAPLRDLATGLPQRFFVAYGSASGTNIVPTTYGVRDTAFQVVDVPAVAAMTAFDQWLGADPVQAGLGYVAIANQVRALRWSAAGVTVDDASLLQTQALFGGLPTTAGADAVYLANGNALVALAGGAARAVGSFTNTVQVIRDAGDHVAALETLPLAAQCCSVIESLAKSGGAPVEADSGSLTATSLVAAGPAGLVVSDLGSTGAGLRLLGADGRSRTPVDGQLVGVVRAAAARLDQPAEPLALLLCVADAAQVGTCAAGAVTQRDLVTGASLTLGTLAPGGTWLRGDFVDGVAGALSGQTFLDSATGFARDETDVRDAWQLTPGGAGTFVRGSTWLGS